MGAIGAAAGLESEGVMLAGLLGASIADELLKTKPIYTFFED
jgi:glycine/D-amino acid oxidase-like deaminating enzyme